MLSHCHTRSFLPFFLLIVALTIFAVSNVSAHRDRNSVDGFYNICLLDGNVNGCAVLGFSCKRGNGRSCGLLFDILFVF